MRLANAPPPRLPLFDPRLLRNADWLLLALALLIAAYGLLMIYSATQTDESLQNGGDPSYLVRQLIWLGLSLVVLAGMMSFDYHHLRRFVWVIYGGNVLLLLLVLIPGLGHTVGGSQRWLPLGPFRLQPSEYAKIAFIITLAFYLSEQEDVGTWGTVFKSFLHLALPMVLILKQPDMGTALVFLSFWFEMLWVARARGLHLLLFFLAGLGVFGLMWHFDVLHDYQKDRLRTVLNPEADPRGKGYQVIQSKIAIGSGQVWGKGYLRGIQTRRRFIPTRHTDNIFSVVAEEFGFAGGCALLLLFSLFAVWRCFNVVLVALDDFGRLIAAGIACLFIFHVFVNMGMATGIMPVTGIPLPFLSYGGSNLMTNLAAVGLLLNIGMHRHDIQFG